jgi:hypothetical protein
LPLVTVGGNNCLGQLVGFIIISIVANCYGIMILAEIVYTFYIYYSINLKCYVKTNINTLIIQVWALRLDINVLNHKGNLVAAASAAALSALSHFRCPSVTITGQETIIHDPTEKDPIPLNLHHYPVCVSYAIFNKG